ncbi:hypothetical protein ABZ313_40335 [Streptomyces sp. NPDC006251]|uniref:hypothetical protein n=1 Tax=Streptomyces sp. NPDC006251 TaxID=3155718 RepID=UPI0033A8C0B3
MTILKHRATLVGAVPLILILVGGYIWYQMSDTGKGWRYKDRLATYCNGLIPYDESAVFTSLSTEVGLPHDEHRGFGDDSFNSCRVADMTLTIALIADDAINSRSDRFEMLDTLRSSASDTPPRPLGGGWQGYTDLRNTDVVLSCSNKPASIVVSIAGDESHENAREARKVGELAAATARKASAHWSCKTKFGGRIPSVSGPAVADSPHSATGTCKGIRITGYESMYIDWLKESKTSGTSPLEMCVLGEFGARSERLYVLEAAFGPYAQRLRSTADEPGAMNAHAGLRLDMAWATAACPGSARAIFTIYATEYADPRKTFLVKSLRAFAERSATRHGCTDLRLPS